MMIMLHPNKMSKLFQKEQELLHKILKYLKEKKNVKSHLKLFQKRLIIWVLYKGKITELLLKKCFLMKKTKSISLRNTKYKNGVVQT